MLTWDHLPSFDTFNLISETFFFFFNVVLLTWRLKCSIYGHKKDLFLIIILKGNTGIGFYGDSQNLQ